MVMNRQSFTKIKVSETFSHTSFYFSFCLNCDVEVVILTITLGPASAHHARLSSGVSGESESKSTVTVVVHSECTAACCDEVIGLRRTRVFPTG